MRLHDRARIEAAVQRIGWWLDWYHMPGRRRREVVRELRANLADAAAAGELREAVTRLGAPKAVAAAYLQDDRSGLRWRAGLIAAAVAFVVVTWLLFAFMSGFAEGVRAVGAEAGEVYETGRGLVVGDRPLMSYRQTGDALFASGALLTWAHVVAVVVAFAVFARPWRALRRGRAQQTQPA